jgi:membrane protease YdiL (CAAX protease family)
MARRNRLWKRLLVVGILTVLGSVLLAAYGVFDAERILDGVKYGQHVDRVCYWGMLFVGVGLILIIAGGGGLLIDGRKRGESRPV